MIHSCRRGPAQLSAAASELGDSSSSAFSSAGASCAVPLPSLGCPVYSVSSWSLRVAVLVQILAQ